MKHKTNPHAVLRAVLVVFGLGTGIAHAGQITALSAAGWPNGRTVAGETPLSVIDGNLSTYTYTTNPNNTATPSYLAISFAETELDRIRLWKYSYGGGGNDAKNLVIQYTDDTNPDLTARVYTTVADLISGFEDTELWDGTVNLNGTVTNDVHNSSTDGWGSLSFDSVLATGVRISFANPAPVVNYCDGTFLNQACNHYLVAEFQAYDDPATPEPGTILLLGGGLAAVHRGRRLRLPH